MSTVNFVERAIEIAVEAHHGQVDKKGEPYILHLLRVMMSFEDPFLRQVAILHDLIEDTGWTLESLAKEGFNSKVLESIDLLTRPRTMTYCRYIARLKGDTMARQVKLADIRDNYSIDRVAMRDTHLDEDQKRVQRYILSTQYLNGELSLGDYRRCMQDNED